MCNCKYNYCFHHRTNPKYKDSPPEAVFGNILGLLLVIFGSLILWIATRTSWKRPSDQTLHVLHTNSGGEDTKVGPAMSELTDETNAESGEDVRRRSNKLPVDDQVD